MPDHAVAISPHVLCEQLDDEIVLLDMRSGHYFGLSPVATRLWSHLQQGSTLEQAQAALLAEFEVDMATLEADVEELVRTLEEKALLERLPQENASLLHR
jgi:hypothetical protein